MDEVDAVPRPRRQRPKDSFQNELQSKLRQRKSLGLSADLSDTEEEGLGPEISDYRAGRTSLRGGLGTTTMGARDLTQMLGRSRYDDGDEDEEVAAANYGRSIGGRDARFSNKTPTLPSPGREQGGKYDSLYGRKTPTSLDKSPNAAKSPQNLSKEDIIFGRKTPSSDGKKSPVDGSRRLPGMDGTGDKWQPPNFRSVSPSSSVEHSRGSRGVTPIDSALGTISETPREKVTPRLHKGQGFGSEISPRQLSYGQTPKPQARSTLGDRKTPPIGGDRRTSPLGIDRKTPPIASERKTPPYSTERKTPPIGGDRKTPPLTDMRLKSPYTKSGPESDGQLKRSTPTLDIFGKSRTAAADDLGSYLVSKDKDELSRAARTEKQLGYSRTGKNVGKGTDSKSQGVIPSPRGRQQRQQQQPTVQDRTRSPLGRKTPTKTDLLSQKEAPKDKRASLLDFLMDGGDEAGSSTKKPKPRAGRGQDVGENEYGDSLYSSKKPSLRNKSPGIERPYAIQRRKSQEETQILSQPEEMFKTSLEQQRPEDTSSLCEDIPADPNRKLAREAQEQARRSGKQTTERAKADSAIDIIADAQTMEYIEPAKKMRPFTASAKVQHRPKPRYPTLPGSAKQPLQERNFNSTGDIRDAIYEEWYRERQKSARKKKKEEEDKKKKEEEKKKNEEKEKRLEAEASYKAWMEKKKEVLLVEKEKKEEEEAKKREKEKQEKEEKHVESIKSFQHWKTKKDAMIKRELYKKAEQKEREEEEKKYEAEQKRKERETAFRGWTIKKEKDLKKQVLEKKYMEKTTKQQKNDEEEEARRKEEEALDRYTQWLEDKEKQQKQERRRVKTRRLMGEDEFKPAFRPASRTIPFGH